MLLWADAGFDVAPADARIQLADRQRTQLVRVVGRCHPAADAHPTEAFNSRRATAEAMSDAVTRSCPVCETDREFYAAARTTVHLGEKWKFRCPECGYTFVRIDSIETA